MNEIDKSTAEYIARVVFKAGSNISELLVILKNFEDNKEAKQMADSLFKASRIMAEEITLRIFEKHPEIQKTFEETIEKFHKIP